jgi:small subunit ribosomal protein S4
LKRSNIDYGWHRYVKVIIMRKLRKTYKRPKRMWDKARIERDKKLKDTFGLVKEREIWNAETTLRKYRRMARQLVGTKNKEKEKELLSKLAKMGILEKGATLDDVLGMNVENVLNRRMQTVVLNKKIANTPKHARQMIVHGHVKVGGRVYKLPGRMILKEEEGKIEFIKKPKGEKKAEEKPEGSV